MRTPARGRAGGKVILLGEHVVVYGRPAIATGLPLGLEAEVSAGDGPALASEHDGDPRGADLVRAACAATGLDPARVVVRVRSELPPGRGLGSSAALAVATLRACAAAAGRTLSTDEELALGRRLEGVFHGTPSGIDPAAAALGRCFGFVRGEPPVVTPLAPPAPLPLVVAFGACPRDTGAAVGGLRARWDAEPATYEALFDAVAAVVARGAEALLRGDLTGLGAAFDENQTLLERLGVSSDEIGTLVATARRLGALGAKLTGGGAGGAIIALATDPETLAARLADATGVQALALRVGRAQEVAA
ncbi:MAG: mevalonate kinase [bacterium]|nr:mevalonate kinase [bacterium]